MNGQCSEPSPVGCTALPRVDGPPAQAFLPLPLPFPLPLLGYSCRALRTVLPDPGNSPLGIYPGDSQHN